MRRPLERRACGVCHGDLILCTGCSYVQPLSSSSSSIVVVVAVVVLTTSTYLKGTCNLLLLKVCVTTYLEDMCIQNVCVHARTYTHAHACMASSGAELNGSITPCRTWGPCNSQVACAQMPCAPCAWVARAPQRSPETLAQMHG